MKSNSAGRKMLSPAAVVGAAAALGMLTAGLSEIQLVLSRIPSGPMVAINLKGGLMLAIPIGVAIALSAVSVGLGLRALTRRVTRCGPRATSIVAGVGVAATSVVGLLVIGQVAGLSGIDWWPAIPCVIGAIVFAFWSEARDRRLSE